MTYLIKLRGERHYIEIKDEVAKEIHQAQEQKKNRYHYITDGDLERKIETKDVKELAKKKENLQLPASTADLRAFDRNLERINHVLSLEEELDLLAKHKIISLRKRVKEPKTASDFDIAIKDPIAYKEAQELIKQHQAKQARKDKAAKEAAKKAGIS